MVYAKHTRTWLNSLGAEWRNEIQLGYSSNLSTSLYQPLDVSQRFFVEPSLSLTRSRQDVFFGNERLATAELTDRGGAIDIGANLGANAQVRLGYLYTLRESSVETGAPILPEDERSDAGLTMSATFDSRDTQFNPTRGIAAAMEYSHIKEALGADLDWDRLELGVGMAVPVRNDVVWMTLAGGTSLDSEIPADRYFLLGGPGSFPGFELGELRLTDYWTASGSYLWKFKDLVSIRGQALYAGVRLEAGQAIGRLEQLVSPAFDDEEMIYGGSVYITGRTQAGPLTLGLGMTSTSSWSLWLAVGRPIGNGTILERGIFR